MNMKIIGLFIISLGLIIQSCGNTEKKTESEQTEQLPGDTGIKVPSPPPPPEAKPSESVKPAPKNDPGDVLANINQHLVTTQAFDPPASGAEGISNCMVTIHNTLRDATFQKAIIEVSILLADGKEYRTDYYTVVNIDPGQKKLVKIPNTTRGTKVTSRVVKVRSNELTKGESVTVGANYVPK